MLVSAEQQLCHPAVRRGRFSPTAGSRGLGVSRRFLKGPDREYFRLCGQLPHLAVVAERPEALRTGTGGSVPTKLLSADTGGGQMRPEG